jgi:hypothetical protein
VPRRLINGLKFGIFVGVVTAAVSVVPALFIQTVFVGGAERCEQLIRYEEAAFDEVRTTCEEDLNQSPFWFPAVIIWGGASLGAIGGFTYGAFRPIRVARQLSPRLQPSARSPGTQ